MTKAKPMPSDIKLITRNEIAVLSGVSLSKVHLAVQSKTLGFPPLAGHIWRKDAYDRSQVTAWLEKNDLKNIAFTMAERALAVPQKEKSKQSLPITFGNDLMAMLKIDIKNTAFKVYGKTVTVHLVERNESELPHPKLTRFSNSGADHRLQL